MAGKERKRERERVCVCVCDIESETWREISGPETKTSELSPQRAWGHLASGGQWLGTGWAPWRGGGRGGYLPPFECIPDVGCSLPPILLGRGRVSAHGGRG